MGQGVDLGGQGVPGDGAETGEGVGPVDIHGTGAADALPAGPTEGQRGVDLILDFNEDIKHHRTTPSPLQQESR